MPGSTNVVALSRVKSHLGISGSSQDVALTALIRATGQSFVGVQGLQRDFYRRSWRVRTPGIGGTLLPLPVWPVESVSLVAEGPDDYATTITAADYEIAQDESGRAQCLYRHDGWSESRGAYAARQGSGGDESLDYKVECIAGWLMPDQVTDWTTALVFTAAQVAAGIYVRATAPSLFLFQVTTAGTMGAAEPTWPTTLDDTVVSGTATLTARAARRWPDELEEAALLTVSEWHGGGLEIPAGISAERIDGGSIDYNTSGIGATSPIPPSARAVLAAYR